MYNASKLVGYTQSTDQKRLLERGNYRPEDVRKCTAVLKDEAAKGKGYILSD